MNSEWQLPPPALLEDASALSNSVEQIYREINARVFQDDSTVNSALPIETRAVRSVGPWQALLLLTPWMLARLLLPREQPSLMLPADWTEQGPAETVVLGPLLQFTLLDTPQKAHLNHHPTLGHYLIQPLVLSMDSFSGAEDVYAAWNEVIRTRDENMKKMARECQLQQEVSRREFFRGLLQNRQ